MVCKLLYNDQSGREASIAEQDSAACSDASLRRIFTSSEAHTGGSEAHTGAGMPGRDYRAPPRYTSPRSYASPPSYRAPAAYGPGAQQPQPSSP